MSEHMCACDHPCPCRLEWDKAKARVAELEAERDGWDSAAMTVAQRRIEEATHKAEARVAALEAHNKRMWDFIVSLDGMNAGHMHDGAIDDEIAIVASDFNALAAAEHSQKPEPDRQD